MFLLPFVVHQRPALGGWPDISRLEFRAMVEPFPPVTGAEFVMFPFFSFIAHALFNMALPDIAR